MSGAGVTTDSVLQCKYLLPLPLSDCNCDANRCSGVFVPFYYSLIHTLPSTLVQVRRCTVIKEVVVLETRPDCALNHGLCASGRG